MFSSILIGVDGRPGGREAIALAAELSACWPVARVTLAHVHVRHQRGSGRRQPIPSPGVALDALLAGERDRSGVDADLRWVMADTLASGLASLMHEVGADLLVLGSSHRGPAARVLLGDSSASTLEVCDAAMAIAPSGYQRTELHTLGVGHDGSAAAAAAFASARTLRDESSRHLGLTCATVIPPKQIPYGAPVDASVKDALMSALSDEEARAVHDEQIATYAAAGQEGPRMAAFSRQVDLLVLGAPRNGRQHLRWAGSTAAYLARHARCSLLVLPLIGPRLADSDVDVAVGTHPSGADPDGNPSNVTGPVDLAREMCAHPDRLNPIAGGCGSRDLTS